VDDCGGAADAVGVANRGAAEFHDLEGGFHFALPARFHFRTGVAIGWMRRQAALRDVQSVVVSKG
jgi:hypothetical protein